MQICFGISYTRTHFFTRLREVGSVIRNRNLGNKNSQRDEGEQPTSKGRVANEDRLPFLGWN